MKALNLREVIKEVREDLKILFETEEKKEEQQLPYNYYDFEDYLFFNKDRSVSFVVECDLSHFKDMIFILKDNDIAKDASITLYISDEKIFISAKVYSKEEQVEEKVFNKVFKKKEDKYEKMKKNIEKLDKINSLKNRLIILLQKANIKFKFLEPNEFLELLSHKDAQKIETVIL